MLRRTAAKAFGPEQKEETRAETAQPAGATRGKASGKPKVPGKPKAPGKRQEAVEHLFGDLRTIPKGFPGITHQSKDPKNR